MHRRVLQGFANWEHGLRGIARCRVWRTCGPCVRNHEPLSALDQALTDARESYLERRPRSVSEHATAKQYMPGGNTRTVLFHGPVPLRVVQASGCRLQDADGHEYVNFLGEYTAGLFGHGHPVIRAAIDAALDAGISLSAHNPHEVELARLVCERFPSIESVRFTNSGTEANLLAISTARFQTGRSKVLVFRGGYHGSVFYFRSGDMPINAPFDYLVADYNDTESCRELIRANAVDLACVLVEPMQGATGCIPASREFLQTLREECSACGALLIFDEVMTSRLSPGGAQQLFDVMPDMTTLGKYIAGGMSIGAFGGRMPLMDCFDPEQPDSIPHAGTFNNNVLSMAAGVAALRDVLSDDLLDAVNRRGDRLRSRLNDVASELDLPMQFTGMGSLIAMHAVTGEIRSIHDIQQADSRKTELLFLALLERGYYIAPRGFLSLMLSVGDAECDGLVQAVTDILSQYRTCLID